MKFRKASNEGSALGTLSALALYVTGRGSGPRLVSRVGKLLPSQLMPTFRHSTFRRSAASDLSDIADDPRCHMFGPTALVVQALMGVLVIASLVYKRQRELPRRKWKVW